MTDDIVARLRADPITVYVADKAADEIKQLRAAQRAAIDDAFKFRTKLQEAEAQIERKNAALREGRRAVGDHFAPNDCYATGPLTGDPFRDLVECPACSFILKYEIALAPAQEKTND